jgi:hypothetical protein
MLNNSELWPENFLGYFTTLPVARPHITSNNRTHESSIGKDVERSNTFLNEALSRQLLGGTEQNNGKLKSSYPMFGRSQWPRGLRHELPSLAPTLGSWVRIPLKAWISVLCAFILCLCCSLCR